MAKSTWNEINRASVAKTRAHKPKRKGRRTSDRVADENKYERMYSTWRIEAVYQSPPNRWGTTKELRCIIWDSTQFPSHRSRFCSQLMNMAMDVLSNYPPNSSVVCWAKTPTNTTIDYGQAEYLELFNLSKYEHWRARELMT